MVRFLASCVIAAGGAALAACGPAPRVALTPDAPVKLWEPPAAVAAQDLFAGPWSADRAPDPNAVYTFVEAKHTGVNLGMTVRDPRGREWNVKLPPFESSDTPESQIEVVISRVLSGLGYFQPPVYYLPAFQLRDDWGSRWHVGGRFRLKDKSLKDRGTWSWNRNPFVGTRPFNGLLVLFMILSGSDLKDSNNTLYEHRGPAGPEYWFVVRDVGTALGSTGRMSPQRGFLPAFDRRVFIRGVDRGYVIFDYSGFHQELVRRRITPADVGWACELAGQLTEQQWLDAFRAGAYAPDDAEGFIRRIQSFIALGRDVAATGRAGAAGRR